MLLSDPRKEGGKIEIRQREFLPPPFNHRKSVFPLAGAKRWNAWFHNPRFFRRDEWDRSAEIFAVLQLNRR